LSCNCPYGFCTTIRQPGECRNLRVAHSVSDEKLVSFGVVRDRMRIA
jgi:hypothetical protein